MADWLVGFECGLAVGAVLWVLQYRWHKRDLDEILLLVRAFPDAPKKSPCAPEQTVSQWSDPSGEGSVGSLRGSMHAAVTLLPQPHPSGRASAPRSPGGLQ